MEIKKNMNGYTIDVDFDEYDKMVDAFHDAQEYWNKHFGLDVGILKYGILLEDMVSARKRYLTAEEAKPFISCMVCKHCLPPMKRENGKMCTLEKCDPDPA